MNTVAAPAAGPLAAPDRMASLDTMRGFALVVGEDPVRTGRVGMALVDLLAAAGFSQGLAVRRSI